MKGVSNQTTPLTPPPPEKLPSKSPVLLGLNVNRSKNKFKKIIIRNSTHLKKNLFNFFSLLES